MNDLQLFNFNGSNIRTLTIEGEPYFVGKDIAEVLGYEKPSQAIAKKVKEKHVEVLTYKGQKLGKVTSNGTWQQEGSSSTNGSGTTQNGSASQSNK